MQTKNRKYSPPTEVSDQPGIPETAFDVTEQDSNTILVFQNYYTQYQVSAGKDYTPCPETVSSIPSGCYKTGWNGNLSIPVFEKQPFNISELIRFEDSIFEEIIDEIAVFWTMKQKYLEHGESHKRGFLLYGPPGGGKTSLVKLLVDDFIKNEGIVFYFTYHIDDGIKRFREIEPDVPVMIILEDIDSLIQDGDSENKILGLLDGEIQLENTIILATTNYPERLPDRIKNRPSRFDRIEAVGLPSAKDRTVYLKAKNTTLTSVQIKKWTKDTKGFTLAHIKELLLSVEVFNLKYEDTLTRLNIMRERLATSKDFEKDMNIKKTGHDIGFN
jgi:SpoVK/Ycf46/Vps4 family AAA+-type ATPase